MIKSKIADKIRHFATRLLAKRAFVIPYRYRAEIASLPAYTEIANLLQQNAEIARHVALLSSYREDLDRIARHGPGPAPRWQQDWFPALDAVAYYTFIRLYRPARIVEIGAGHSTRFALQALKDGGLDTKLIVIDPAPRAHWEKDHPAVEWRPHRLEEIAEDFWSRLQAGDFLFIDSSHILMPGTDLDWLLNRVLPNLPPHTLVHFHDIFLPDPYPEDWQWRGYNEQQAIAALLFNPKWQLLFSSRQAQSGGRMNENMPKILREADHRLASSIWFRKEKGE